MYALLEHGGLAELVAPLLASDADSQQLMKMACLLAAAIHDYEHQGVNNDYLVKTRHAWAIRYNDQHVNEHHHVAHAFDLLLQPEHNFVEHLGDKEFRRLRGLVIDLVIATDMADNTQFVKSLTSALSEHAAAAAATADDDGETKSPTFVPSSEKQAALVLRVAMKCADLGHLALEWDTHVTWVRCLEVEFFKQGDLELERGLSVSFLMDRHRPGASDTQVGFFDFVVLPLFRVLIQAVPLAEPFLDAASENYRRWKELDEAKKAAQALEEESKTPAQPSKDSTA
uniref:PDEase domain-containing protein n=1 Tax=Alexandrium andersonii TaxID=327968 RepID=A0A7S2FUT2_9DINO